MEQLQEIILQAARSASSPQEYAEIIQRFEALKHDANRWRGLRLVLAEKDEAAQTRMFEAVDAFMESRPDLRQENVTPDALDRLIDELLVIAGGARDANS